MRFTRSAYRPRTTVRPIIRGSSGASGCRSSAPCSVSFGLQIFELGRRVVVEQKAKQEIKGMFGTYVSPELVNRMVESGEDPQLGGHEEEITPYFSDIQGFSTFSEKLTPARLVELMNEYLTACTDIVQAEGGTLDKYIGDAVVAMFGAPMPLPDHAFRACVASQLRAPEARRAAREMEERGRQVAGDRLEHAVAHRPQQRRLPSIGNMGSRTRFNYTMMGDNVNLAARMESGAKSWGVYTMVHRGDQARLREAWRRSRGVPPARPDRGQGPHAAPCRSTRSSASRKTSPRRRANASAV